MAGQDGRVSVSSWNVRVGGFSPKGLKGGGGILVLRLAFVMEYESGRFSQLGVFGGGHLDYRVRVCSRNVKVGCFCRREALGDLDCKVDVCSWNVRVGGFYRSDCREVWDSGFQG